MSTNPDVIRVANCSGFYGDRLSAAREMVGGGPIDVLTGDYLAELTMAILYSKKAKDPNGGFLSADLGRSNPNHAAELESAIKLSTAVSNSVKRFERHVPPLVREWYPRAAARTGTKRCNSP